MHFGTARGTIGACDGRFDDHTDPARSFVLFLRSRRVDRPGLERAIAVCRRRIPTKRQVRRPRYVVKFRVLRLTFTLKV